MSSISEQNSIRVLIVINDNRLVSSLITALSIYPDIDLVGTAANGVEAIAHCQQLNPNVVLIELVMPELDGVTAIQEIHQHQPDIKIITISKFVEESLVRQARHAGAVGNVRLGDSADSIATKIHKLDFNTPHEQHLLNNQKPASKSPSSC